VQHGYCGEANIQNASVNRAIFKNVINSKCFHLFSFNTYEYNLDFSCQQNGDSGIRPSVAEPEETVLQNRPTH
jgi:hypothetical protein